MASFDSVLNFIIPWLVGLGLIYLLYKPFAKMFSGIGTWFGNLWDKISGKEVERHKVESIQYE